MLYISTFLHWPDKTNNMCQVYIDWQTVLLKGDFSEIRSGTINSLAELLEFNLVAIPIQSQTEMKLSDKTVTHRNIAQQTQKDLLLSDKTVTYRNTAL